MVYEKLNTNQNCLKSKKENEKKSLKKQGIKKKDEQSREGRITKYNS